MNHQLHNNFFIATSACKEFNLKIDYHETFYLMALIKP